jgi:hypothetical protein
MVEKRLSNLNRTLLSLSVTETDRGKEYWASRPGLSPKTAAEIRAADFLIVPWEDFRPGSPALFPQGTTDFIQVLREGGLREIGLAVDPSTYSEIALHADEWRLPTVFCGVIALPIFLNILSNHLDQWLFSRPTISIVEEELIIATGHGQCFSIHYKGPPADLVQTFKTQADSCIQPKPKHGHSVSLEHNRHGGPHA